MKTPLNSFNSEPWCAEVVWRGRIIAVLLLTLSLMLPNHAWAATNIVLSTDDLQQQIDAAAPGDVMVIQSGAYSGNISITKPLSFVRSGTNVVQWLGTASINSTGKVTMVQMNFSLAVTVVGGAELLIQDSILNTTLNVTGGKVTVKRSNVAGRLDVASGEFTGLRMTNAGGVYAVATVGTGRQFVMAQSSADYVSITGYKSWLAYNTFRQLYQLDCNTLIVGNKGTFTQTPNGAHSVLDAQNCTIRAYNNVLVTSATSQSSVVWSVSIYGFRLTSCNGEIANNTIWCSVSAYDGWWESVLMYARGIQSFGGGPILVKGNAIYAISSRSLAGGADYQSAYAVVGGPEIAELSYCRFETTHGVNGVTPYQCSFGGLGLNGDYTPAFNSPCIDAGPPEASFKDRDGTRNDIGFTGGPLYQPNGATTSNPLLFLLMPAQRQVWKNAQPTLDVETTATAGH